MKPDWDTLMESFKDHATTLVADVDCTTGGKSLCNEIGVRGYPTIKHGDPNDLQDYKGGRDLAALKKFAEGLGPQCGPSNLDLCSDEKKAQIDEYMALSAEKRAEMVTEKEAKITELEAGLKTFLEGLQKQYEEASKKKDADVEEVKNSGLGLLKAVQAHMKKSGKSEL